MPLADRAANPSPGIGARLVHTMLRVTDLDRSIAFYTGPLGMRELRREEYPDGEFTLSFVGYGEEHKATAIELTHNWGDHTYERGTAYGHIALGVPDIHAAAERLRASGVKILREPGPMKHGTDVIAFVEDPDGYRVELIEETR